MSNDTDWITILVSEARKNYPSISNAIADRLEELLKSQLYEHQLHPTELAAIAKSLIEQIVPFSPEGEEIE